MKRGFKHVFRKGKPDDISQEIWDDYVTKGTQTRFWRMNGAKTLLVTVMVTFGLNLILSETIDLFVHNPHNHTPQSSITSITLGVICIILSIGVVLVIDSAEEYKRLKDKEREEEERKEKEAHDREVIKEIKTKVEKNYVSKKEINAYIDKRVKEERCKE